MADVEELLSGVPVRLAPAQGVRRRGERRRARQRAALVTAVLVAVTAAGVGSWTVLMPAGPRGTDVASEGENPFMPRGTGDGSYSGMPNSNGPRLEVSVRHWGNWVGVVEAQHSPTP